MLLISATQDSEIGGYFIPKGYHILVNLWAIHNDTDYWTEPEKFQPSRFLSADGTKIVSNESYAPFAVGMFSIFALLINVVIEFDKFCFVSGKRACPGEALALVEVFLYTAAILQRFTIDGPPGKILSTEARVSLISLLPQFNEYTFIPRLSQWPLTCKESLL